MQCGGPEVVFYVYASVYADLCSLLAATSQFSILIGQKMQLTGCHNDNEMRNAISVDTNISIEWPYCSSLYCALIREQKKQLLHSESSGKTFPRAEREAEPANCQQLL